MKRKWNVTAGLAIAAAAVVVLSGCGSTDSGSTTGGGEQSDPSPQTSQTAQVEKTAPASTKGPSGGDQKEGATDFQNAVADAVKKRYSGLERTGNDSQMPTKVGQHKTVPYSTAAKSFTCDTVYMGGENVKLTKCLNPAGEPVPDPAPDPPRS